MSYVPGRNPYWCENCKKTTNHYLNTRCMSCTAYELCMACSKDHSKLLDWGDTTSEEYMCYKCQPAYKEKERVRKEEENKRWEREKKKEELMRAYEREQQRKTDEEKKLAEAAAKKKMDRWLKNNPNWAIEQKAAYMKAHEDKWSAEYEKIVKEKMKDVVKYT